MGSRKIVEYVEYLITCGGQRVLQRSHIAQLIHFSVLLTDIAEPLVTLMLFVRHEQSTRRATPLTLTHGFFVHCALLVVDETRVASKMPVAFGTRESKVAEWTGHAVTTRLVADVRDVTCT